MGRALIPLLICLHPAPVSQENFLGQAQSALQKGDAKLARELAGKAIGQSPRSPNPYYLRGIACGMLDLHAEAVADFDEVIRLDPKFTDAYQHRGSEQFKLAKPKESVADFDRFLELRPAERPGHWQRGISCYYAGQFEEGRKQFQGYEQVDTNDVENAVWHFLCNARLVGVEKATKEILKIGQDRRIPMMKVYEMFAGKASAQDVLKAVEEGAPTKAERDRRLFYAHLYLALYAEAQGDRAKTRDHLVEAEKRKISHYMGEVPRVHRLLLDR